MQDNSTQPYMSVYILDLGVEGKKYIGSSVDTERRTASHLRKLASGTHSNTSMQSDYDESVGLSYEVITDGFETELEMRQLEQRLIQERLNESGRDSLYNKTLLVYPLIVNGGRGGKRVVALDRNNKVVAVFRSGRACAKVIGVPRTTLWSAMNDGRRFKGFLYVYRGRGNGNRMLR